MSDIAIVVSFGGGATLIFAALYAFHLNGQFKLRKALKEQQALPPASSYSFSFSVTFARLYGLLVVAVVGALLAFSSTGSDLVTAAFTLLGTIAGYLAGASSTATGASIASGGGAPSGAAPNPGVEPPPPEEVL
jgi:hypothetical protein